MPSEDTQPLSLHTVQLISPQLSQAGRDPDGADALRAQLLRRDRVPATPPLAIRPHACAQVQARVYRTSDARIRQRLFTTTGAATAQTHCQPAGSTTTDERDNTSASINV